MLFQEMLSGEVIISEAIFELHQSLYGPFYYTTNILIMNTLYIVMLHHTSKGIISYIYCSSKNNMNRTFKFL